MDILEQLGLAMGLATLAGVNLYLTVLLTGVAVRFDLSASGGSIDRWRHWAIRRC